MFAVWAGVSECGVLRYGSDSLCAAVGFEGERGGDVADGVVAEVWFARGGCLTCAVVRRVAARCVVVSLVAVEVVGVLVP